MSAYEALRGLRNKVPWLTDDPGEDSEPAPPPTPLDEAAYLLTLARMPGEIDRQSGTWHAVARRLAIGVIVAQGGLETASDEKAVMLRSRIRTLRDLLEIDERADQPPAVADQTPYVP